MEYALSQKDGVEHRAVAVNYDKAKALNLICPVCGAKVFKRVRYMPEENHCFVHHKGGSLDCELYHAGTVTLTRAAFDAMARGQDFQLFIKQVEQSIEDLLTKTRVVTSIDHAELELSKKTIASIDFEMDEESFDHVEECAIADLGEAGLINNVRVSRILDAKLRFYRHPQARFIDKSITSWTLYVIATKHPQANMEKLADVMTSNTVDLEKTAGLIFAGLAARDARVGLSWFSWDFDKLLSAQARRVPKSILNPKSARSKSESHGQSHEDATIVNKTLSNPRTEANAQPATQPNPVDVRFKLAKQKLINAGYRFMRFEVSGLDLALAPDGKSTIVFDSGDLDRLVEAAASLSKQAMASSGPELVSLPNDPEKEKLLRDFQNHGWSISNDGMKWTIVRGGLKHYSWTNEDLKQFWHSKIPISWPSDPEKEKLLRDFQDQGWSISHDGFKWTIWKNGVGSVSAYTADEIRRFWYSNRKN